MNHPVKKPIPSNYENNPFFIALKGIELLFSKAQSVGVLLIVLTAIGVFSALPGAYGPTVNINTDGTTSPSGTEMSPPARQNENIPVQSTDSSVISSEDQAKKDWEEVKNSLAEIPTYVWIIGGLFIAFIVGAMWLVGVLFQGISDYTSSQIARGKNTKLSEAFSAVFKNFWGYVLVMMIVSIKTFLWTLLFFIPGFVMSYRYSLAGVAYFDKNLRGNAAVKDSLALTKNAWLTTFAAESLLPMLTLGLVTQVAMPGTRAFLYRQFLPYTEAGQPKPRAHVLSWLTLVLPIVFVMLFWLLIAGIVAAIVLSQQT